MRLIGLMMVAVGLLAVVAIVAIETGLFTAEQATADVPIRGVDRAELERQNVSLREPRGKTPKVSKEKAIEVAGLSAAVREVVLAELGQPGQSTRVVWVVNYEPAEVEPASYGIPPGPGTPVPDYIADYALHFVDAETGEYIGGIQEGQFVD